MVPIKKKKKLQYFIGAAYNNTGTQLETYHGESRAGVGIGNLISCGMPHSPPEPVLLKVPGLQIHVTKHAPHACMRLLPAVGPISFVIPYSCHKWHACCYLLNLIKIYIPLEKK